MKSIKQYLNFLEEVIQEDPLLFKHSVGCCTFENQEIVDDIPHRMVEFSFGDNHYLAGDILESLGYQPVIHEGTINGLKEKYLVRPEESVYGRVEDGMFAAVKNHGRTIRLMGVNAEDQRLNELVDTYDREEEILLRTGPYFSILGNYIDNFVNSPSRQRVLVDSCIEMAQKIVELGVGGELS